MTAGTAARALPLRVPPSTAPPAPLSSPRALLRLVPQRRSTAARTPFAVVLVVLLVGGLLGLLLLNMLVAQGSFELSRLSAESRALQQQEQQLAARVQQLKAPAGLARRAEALGMVPGGPPAFLRLSDGKVLGKPTKGVRPVAPAQPRPSASPATVTPAAATAPRSSTTWTAPRQSPAPSTGGSR